MIVVVVDEYYNCIPDFVDNAEPVEVVDTADTVDSADTGTGEAADNSALVAPCLKGIET